MTGNVQREAIASFQSLISMITATPITVRKSGISVVTALLNTSFKELTSPIILARIFPVGLLSKKEKDSFWICSYSS